MTRTQQRKASVHMSIPGVTEEILGHVSIHLVLTVIKHVRDLYANEQTKKHLWNISKLITVKMKFPQLTNGKVQGFSNPSLFLT